MTLTEINYEDKSITCKLKLKANLTRSKRTQRKMSQNELTLFKNLTR